MKATEAADGKLSEVHERIWLSPEINDPTPATPAIKANVTKNPVAAFPIGKYMGEKWAGSSNPEPALIVSHNTQHNKHSEVGCFIKEWL